MVRVNASRIIASMENMKTARVSLINLIGYAVRLPEFVSPSKLPISRTINGSFPGPAFIWRTGGYVLKKAYRFGCSARVAMSWDKSLWLTLDPSPILSIPRRKLCFLSTPAMTVAIFYFIHDLLLDKCNIILGTLYHQCAGGAN